MTRFSATVSLSEVSPVQYKTFSCDEPPLDQYLKRFAVNHEKKGIGRTFLLLEKERVIGYYTLSAAQISILDLPESLQKKLPRFPITASRLCRLAVDESCKGKRVGEYLLMDAINRVLSADQSIAIYSLIVDAKPRSKGFYLRYGFNPLEGKELSFFLHLEPLRRASRKVDELEAYSLK